MRDLSFLIATLSVSLAGCYYFGQNTSTDISSRPSVEWSSPENLTMIMEAGNNNLRDYRTNIKVIVTPYYPSVIKAVGRRYQSQEHWTEDQFRSYVDRLLHESSGMYINWDDPGEPVYTGRLERFESPTQFDSLLFLVTLRNTGWPPGKYMLVPKSLGENLPMVNEVVALDDPYYQPPDITHLEDNITLVNQKNQTISPYMVWGRKMNYLTNIDETLFVKFKFEAGTKHFLSDCAKYYLSIRGIESDIKLELSTAVMR